MKILFYLGHPAHYHLFKNIITTLKDNNHDIIVLIKKKDILEYLLKQSNIDFINILPEGRKDGRLGIAIGLIKRDWKIFWLCKKKRPDIMVGTSTEITHVGKLLNIPSIVVNEDDYDAVALFSKLGYPWASNILAPVSCPTGPDNNDWERKTIHYQGFHELAYLHPDIFKPSKNILQEQIDFSKPYVVLRFAKLTAHHDEGKTGITVNIAEKIIRLLKPKYNIYITSERELEPEFEPYRIAVDPIYIHHILFYADMYIGDSQTMAAEAAVLGTPSLRFNDFVGKLGYLEELEHKYGLTYGIKTSEPGKLYLEIQELTSIPDIKKVWQDRQYKMLSDKINVAAFMAWFIENFPSSVGVMKENPEYQNNFLSAYYTDPEGRKGK